MKNIKEENKQKFITLQFTLFDTSGRYKPLSTLIKVESIKWFREHEEQIKQQAIQQICNQRRLTGKELTKLGYTKLKIRNYSLYLKSKRKEKENNE